MKVVGLLCLFTAVFLDVKNQNNNFASVSLVLLALYPCILSLQPVSNCPGTSNRWLFQQGGEQPLNATNLTLGVLKGASKLNVLLLLLFQTIPDDTLLLLCCLYIL